MVVAQAATVAYSTQSQTLLPTPVQTSAACTSSGRSSSYGGEAWRSEIWGSRGSRSGWSGKAGEELCADAERSRIRANRSSRLGVSASGLTFWETLGGRGLKGGEKATNTEEGLKKLFSDPEGSGKKNGEKGSVDGRVEVSGIDGFDKELSGLVGGFPGGEKGLNKFLADYPPPAKKEKATKANQERNILLGVLAGPAEKPKSIAPPLLMPGMTVIVKEPRNPYYMYSGIVQRVTDGRAGVLFEGGNWDKLITFKLIDLERTAQGPPMVNPKSAVLLNQQAPVPPS